MSDALPDRLREVERVLDELHRRLLELEAAIGMLRGSLERARAEAPETPTQITHDVPPDAPR